MTDAKALAGVTNTTRRRGELLRDAGEYIMAGFTVAVIVGAMLVGF